MVRDLADGVAERIEAWSDAAGRPDLRSLEFLATDDVVLVCATSKGAPRPLWFAYTMDGPRIVGWDVYDDETKARKAAGIPG